MCKKTVNLQTSVIQRMLAGAHPSSNYAAQACMWIDDDQDNESGQEINDKDFEVEVYKIEASSDEEDGTKHKDLSKRKIGLSIRRMEKWK